MAKQTQTIRRCLSVSDHFVGLVLKVLISNICQEVLLSVPSPFIFVTVSYIKSLNVFMLKFVLQLTSSNPTTFGKPFSSKTGTPPLYLHATNRERIILCISCTYFSLFRLSISSKNVPTMITLAFGARV